MMSSSSANITSTYAVRSFKAALAQFEMTARDALLQLLIEARRSLDWLESDRTHYWPREVRIASAMVSEARLALDRRRIAVATEDNLACYEERKILEAARQRLELAESKVIAVRRWKIELAKEIEAFDGERAKFEHYLDYDLSRALAALDRMSGALELYVADSHPVKSERG